MSGNWETKDQTFISISFITDIIIYKEIFKKNLIFSLKPGLKSFFDG